MKEIGGYFGLEQFPEKEYHASSMRLNNARNALLYILRARNIKKLYIPAYLCDSVANMLRRYGYEWEYYSIGGDFHPRFVGTLDEHSYLYIVNYYGQLSNQILADLKNRYKYIIVDNVQAFFQYPLPGVDTIYSCRKFFGVPDGAYLSTNAILPQPLEEDVSRDRMTHILGRFETEASAFYADFKKSDQACAESELRHMSRLTRNLLGAIDYDAARQSRNRNYAQLAAAFGERNPLVLTAPDGPYCYPLYCKNGMEIKKRLAVKKIYVPTLWPNVLELEGTLEQDYARNILPLPCDQRYGQEDMERMIMEVLGCIG